MANDNAKITKIIGAFELALFRGAVQHGIYVWRQGLHPTAVRKDAYESNHIYEGEDYAVVKEVFDSFTKETEVERAFNKSCNYLKPRLTPLTEVKAADVLIKKDNEEKMVEYRSWHRVWRKYVFENSGIIPPERGSHSKMHKVYGGKA